MEQNLSLKRKPTALDYTISLTRKYRYWVVSSPEFSFQIASSVIDLDQVNPERVGEAVLKVLASIDSRLHQLDQEGKHYPEPSRAVSQAVWQGRELLSASRAAKVLGVSTSTLRRMVKRGLVRAETTPGGHLRFNLNALSEYLTEKRAA